MPLEIKKYLKHLDDCDLTEAQKLEHIREVRGIFENFIDAAFGIHPVQLLPKKDLQSPKGDVESEPSTNSKDKATDCLRELQLHIEG